MRRLHDMGTLDARRADVLCGDLDSVDERGAWFAKELGVDVIQLDDQNFTDFTKAAQWASKHRPQVGMLLKLLCRSSRSHNTDDFIMNAMKALEVSISKRHSVLQAARMVAIGGLRGRFDHVLASINTLHLLSADGNVPPITVVDVDSLLFLLPPVRSDISRWALGYTLLNVGRALYRYECIGWR